MQELISAAYEALTSNVCPQSGCPQLNQAVQGDAVLRMQAASQRLLVQSNVGVLPDCKTFLQECFFSVTHTYRIEQEYKVKAPGKAAAKGIRLVRACIRAWISAFKRFSKLMRLEHLQLKIHALDRKGSYEVSLEEMGAKDETARVLAKYLECGEYLNVPCDATMQLYEEQKVCEDAPSQEAAKDMAAVLAGHAAAPEESVVCGKTVDVSTVACGQRDVPFLVGASDAAPAVVQKRRYCAPLPCKTATNRAEASNSKDFDVVRQLIGHGEICDRFCYCWGCGAAGPV